MMHPQGHITEMIEGKKARLLAGLEHTTSGYRGMCSTAVLQQFNESTSKYLQITSRAGKLRSTAGSTSIIKNHHNYMTEI